MDSDKNEADGISLVEFVYVPASVTAEEVEAEALHEGESVEMMCVFYLFWYHLKH